MAYIQGKKVLLKFYKDTEYIPFLCATDCSLTINTETKDVRTIGDGIWKKKRGQSKSFTLSLNGLIELQETSPVTFWLIENYDMQMLPVDFEMHFDDAATALKKIVSGRALIVTSILNGVPTGFATSSFEMEGDGALTITDSATVCNATIGLIEIGPGDPDSGYQASVNYTGVTNAARLEYSVDGGPREVIFDPGSDGFFFLSGLSDGPHTITVWAVCESGVDGESNELTFEISGGAAASCAAPGAPVMSAVTATSATATWAAASPVPAAGYFWEYGGVVLGTVLGSGYTASLTIGLTGLIEGGEYFFRVKSLCEEGVSESSFQSVEFTAEPAFCAAPGAVTVVDFAEDTVDASWVAASPVPVHYEWRTILVSNGSVYAFGETTSTTVTVFGLNTGSEYQFQVRSVCEIGISYSAYSTENFIAP